jgi:predicted transcriptional regulator
MKSRTIATLTAKDVMNPQVEALKADAKMLDAVRWLLRRGYAGAPVVDEQGVAVGVLSEHDCIQALIRIATDDTPDERVDGNMTRELHTVLEAAPVLDVAKTFAAAKRRRLLVLDQAGHLVGLISRRDLMKGLEDVLYERERVSTYDILNRLWR